MTTLTKILLGLGITTLTLGGLAGLTKAGFIPNYLDLEILCSKKIINKNIIDEESLDNPSSIQPIPTDFKPVIYLYPKEKTEISVQLDYKGDLFATYPDYQEDIKGWKVTAFPNGDLINSADKKEYSYLFWEGTPKKDPNYDLSTGFVVKGSDSKKFLQKKLEDMGLTPREYNEFIVYWFPKMQDTPYNIIHFAQEEYTETAPLTISPTPDSMLRVFMVFKGIENKSEAGEITPQKINSFKRKGFSVVEWGGSEIR